MSDKEIKVGQIYADRDKRMEGRRVKVKAIEGLYAFCDECDCWGYEYEFKRSRNRRFALKTLRTRFKLVEVNHG
jgi:hypothetical protein